MTAPRFPRAGRCPPARYADIRLFDESCRLPIIRLSRPLPCTMAPSLLSGKQTEETRNKRRDDHGYDRPVIPAQTKRTAVPHGGRGHRCSSHRRCNSDRRPLNLLPALTLDIAKIANKVAHPDPSIGSEKRSLAILSSCLRFRTVDHP